MKDVPEILFDLVLPADRQFWQVREIPGLMALAGYPRTEGEVVTRLLITRENAAAMEMSAKDLATFCSLCAPLDPIKFPLGEDEWRKYEIAFNAAKECPDWGVIPEYRDPSMERELRRLNAERDHEHALKVAMESGQVETLNPLTYAPNTSGGVWLGERYRKDQLITATQIARFAVTLRIRVTAKTAEKPLPTRTRRTLLTIIAALCKSAEIDYSQRGASQRIKEACEAIGAPVDDGTIAKLLTEIPDALESRTRVGNS